MNITKDELSKLLKEAYDEGMCGYEDLKDDYVQQIVAEFSSQDKDKPSGGPSPVYTAAGPAYTGGMTYTSTGTAAYSSNPIEVSFSSTPMFTLDPPAVAETVPSADPHYNFNHTSIPDMSIPAPTQVNNSVNRNGDIFTSNRSENFFEINIRPDAQVLSNIINRYSTNISGVDNITH